MLKKPWLATFFRSRPTPKLVDLERAAELGGAEAQNNLGAFLSNSGEQDAAAASYRKAATQGDAMAQSNLGLMYANGSGVSRDDGLASHWLSRAAVQGYAPAQYHLGGRFHRASLSLQKTEAAEARIEAFKWFQLASAQAYRDATACRERVNIAMSSEDVEEGNRRTYAFVPALEHPES
jgi:uncharacterized protein